MNHLYTDVDVNRRQKLSSDPGRHDLVLVARRGDPSQSAVTDLSNVVPFARRRAVETEFPLAPIAAADRPASSQPDFGVGRRIALLTGSLMLHGLLLAMFWQEPAPLASIGVESMSVEITLGATHAAGLAPQPGEQEVAVGKRRPQETHARRRVTPEQQAPIAEMPEQKAAASTRTHARRRADGENGRPKRSKSQPRQATPPAVSAAAVRTLPPTTTAWSQPISSATCNIRPPRGRPGLGESPRFPSPSMSSATSRRSNSRRHPASALSTRRLWPWCAGLRRFLGRRTAAVAISRSP